MLAASGQGKIASVSCRADQVVLTLCRIKLLMLVFALMLSRGPACFALKCLCRDSADNQTCPSDICDPGKNGKCYRSLGYVVYNADKHYDRSSFLVERAGCHDADKALMQCKAHLTPHMHPHNISCCNYDYCNGDIRLTVASTTPWYDDDIDAADDETTEKALLWLIIAVLFAIVVVLMVCFGAVCIRLKKWREKGRAAARTITGTAAGYGHSSHDINSSTQRRYGWSTTGDESGMTLVTHVSDGNRAVLLPSITPPSMRPATKTSFAVSSTVSSHYYESVPQPPSSTTNGRFAPSHEDIIDSGANEWVLTERTIAKQLQDVEEIGKGRYGKVLRSKLKGEDVAVKVFSSVDESSWQREKDIYLTCMLRHENILGFKAADIRSHADSATEMIMVCDYHPFGSLFDYLQTDNGNSFVLDACSMLKLAHSAAAGLAHLHEEVLGTNSKPGVAHRDIKSKNILVKNDGSSCIADFGLAVRLDMHTRQIVPNVQELRVQQGTRRYMPPEILDLQSSNNIPNAQTVDEYAIVHRTAARQNRFRLEDFECYKRADIYSFGLVLWELNNRCDVNANPDNIPPYYLPYAEHVSNDPSIEEMYHVVVIKGIRPDDSNTRPDWALNALQNKDNRKSFTSLMKECWHGDAVARPTADYIKKQLRDLKDVYYRQQKDQNPHYYRRPGTFATTSSSYASSAHVPQYVTTPFMQL